MRFATRTAIALVSTLAFSLASFLAIACPLSEGCPLMAHEAAPPCHEEGSEPASPDCCRTGEAPSPNDQAPRLPMLLALAEIAAPPAAETTSPHFFSAGDPGPLIGPRGLELYTLFSSYLI